MRLTPGSFALSDLPATKVAASCRSARLGLESFAPGEPPPAPDRRYPDDMPFSSDDLRAIDRAKEIEVETSAGPDSEVHRTITWVVVDGDDVFVRSWRGVTARWFREALANPNIAIHIDGRRVAARAVPARDPGSIARTSAGLVKKYDGDTATPSMVRDEILDTTLRLDPVTTD